jgi:hypothetical protein
VAFREEFGGTAGAKGGTSLVRVLMAVLLSFGLIGCANEAPSASDVAVVATAVPSPTATRIPSSTLGATPSHSMGLVPIAPPYEAATISLSTAGTVRDSASESGFVLEVAGSDVHAVGTTDLIGHVMGMRVADGADASLVAAFRSGLESSLKVLPAGRSRVSR